MIQKFGTVPNWNVKFRKRGVCCKIAEHSRIEQKPLAFTLVKILKVCQKGKQKIMGEEKRDSYWYLDFIREKVRSVKPKLEKLDRGTKFTTFFKTVL